ncbi:hypothetical protein pdam_00015052 [Pocillopora damicornis]|uniref:CUB domain-containing protein n=1 Tax=Pocillopora damicornis TaxID=46731 RepID=A0A3M6TWZ0_POCDA|nr:hypothetical protein pdam_00015052 [Pocillopora damicornis]
MVAAEPALLMALFLAIYLKALNGNSGALATQECGVLVNSTLKSPGYPFTYPADMDCEYSVLIPPGGPMGIYFVDFDVEFHPSCRQDTPPKISLPAVVESLPGYRVKIPVTGTPPIYTAMIRNSTVLVNTTYIAGFQFYNESNCTSVAFNNYGYDTREFSVILKECGVLVNSTLKSSGYPFTYPADMDCEYSVLIPPGGPMGIYFVDFDVEFHPSCRQDTPPKISLPAVVESLPGYRVKVPVTGTPPIYTAIIRNSTVLVNTTYIAGFQFYNESNCTSVAFNNYGYDTREFSVILKGREIS